MSIHLLAAVRSSCGIPEAIIPSHRFDRFTPGAKIVSKSVDSVENPGAKHARPVDNT